MLFPRMTTRRWMVVVAVVGGIMVIVVWSMRSLSYLRMAQQYAATAAATRKNKSRQDARLVRARRAIRSASDPAYRSMLADAARLEAQAKHYEQLSSKYERAARHPWLPVPLGMPRPK